MFMQITGMLIVQEDFEHKDLELCTCQLVRIQLEEQSTDDQDNDKDND